MEILNLGSHRIGVRFPEKGLCKGKNPAILLNDGELIEQLNLRTERAVLVGVYPNNRLSEYTPWPEPAIRPGTPDFGGQLGQYHRELNNEILPALIDEYALDTEKLAYGGYSLGGLAATMSLWETDAFAAVFSLCGSFWYPGVADFIEEHVPKNYSAQVYLQMVSGRAKATTTACVMPIAMPNESTLPCKRHVEPKLCWMTTAIMTGKVSVLTLHCVGWNVCYESLA